jgi:uncharacterized membrane protein
MNKILKKVIWLFVFAPVIYLAVIWKSLPQTVAVHFNIDGKPDRYGSKNELWGVSVLLLAVSIGTYLLITNIHRIDPKRYQKEMQDKYDKIAVTVIVFLSAIHFFVIYASAVGGINFAPGLIFSAVSILFAVIGNYMYTIKPNYFVGIRVPWTLSSNDNWRKTHQFAARLWFIAGIIMAILTLLLPATPAMILFYTGTALITIIPIVYSYKLFTKEKATNKLL